MKRKKKKEMYFLCTQVIARPHIVMCFIQSLLPRRLKQLKRFSKGFLFLKGIGLTSHEKRLEEITLVSSVLHIRYDNKMPG